MNTLKTLKINFTGRGIALALATMLLFCTVIVQPTHAQSVVNQIKCGALQTFQSAATGALALGKAAMEAAFNLEISLLQAAWQVQDMAVSAIRSVSEAGFKATLAAFSLFAFGTARRNAINTYRDVLLNALNVLHTKIDAARAAYREDMLALVRAHQKALTNIVDTLITTITNATNYAVAHCSDNNVVATLLGTIAQANITLVAQGLAQDVKDLAKAVTLVVTRDSAFLQADLEFAGIALKATIELTAVMLTGRGTVTVPTQQ